MNYKTDSRVLRSFIYIGPILDFLSVVFSGIIAYQYMNEGHELHDRYWLAICIVGLLLLLINNYSGGYSKYHEKSTVNVVFLLLFSWILSAFFSTSIVYFLHVGDKFSRLWFVLLMFWGVVGGSAIRIIFNFLAHIIPVSLPRKKIYIIGDVLSLNKVMNNTDFLSGIKYELVGFTEISSNTECQQSELNLKICSSKAQEIWLAMPLEMGGILKEILYFVRHQTAEIRYLPDISDLPLINKHVSNVLDMVSIDLSVTPMKGWPKVWKRVEDIVFSVLALIIFSPLFAIISLMIKIESNGPVIFKQYRTGINGRKFKVYKFRSMVVHSEVNGKVTQAARNDSRVTRIGAFLRKTSLDELPQFYNVLQGRMSVVGPRPHALAHNEYYKEIVESYMQRHKVKPGITGWAQVCGYRGETDTLDKMQKRVQMDIWYICNWSILLDVKIIFMTVFKGFINKNAF